MKSFRKKEKGGKRGRGKVRKVLRIILFTQHEIEKLKRFIIIIR